MIRTALIMAGGKGERFWPRSRQSLPKQFLSLTDDKKTMIQLTVERISPIVNIEDVYVVTNEQYRDLVTEQLPELPEDNIICEPIGRNTAPCIGLGCMKILKKYEGLDPTVIVLPSDHLIKHNAIFKEALFDACDVAESGPNLVTIGITPNYPETGYGYIKYDENVIYKESYGVRSFVEKPDLTTAKNYLAEGTYLWNSGMFIWSANTIIEEFKKHLPDMFEKLNQIEPSLNTKEERKTIKNIFPDFESISIDYGIMEKAENIYIIPGNFGWDDVGSWLAVSRINHTDSNNNHIVGNVIDLDVNNCTIEAEDKLIAAIGISDMIVIDSGDAILISSKSKAGDIKKILAELRKKGMTKYL